jgi:putative Mg2+ transporter-C (MgtC) family protein
MISEWTVISRLLLAAVLGGLIGYERERLSWAAGLRTHMLVCVGSALIMIVSAYGFADILGTPNVVLDPSRIAAQVVSGIGFLGAGSILVRRDAVRGLTTAASVWAVAAVGLAVGGGLYIGAVPATVIILIILAGIKPLERKFISARQKREFQIVAARGSVSVGTVEEALGAGSVRVSRFIVDHDDSPDTDRVRLVLSRLSERQYEHVRRRLVEIDGVHKVE